jgi:hypothetical protein
MYGLGLARNRRPSGLDPSLDVLLLGVIALSLDRQLLQPPLGLPQCRPATLDGAQLLWASLNGAGPCLDYRRRHLQSLGSSARFDASGLGGEDRETPIESGSEGA